MMRLRQHSAVLFVLFGMLNQACADDMKDLLARVPNGANALVRADVQGLFASPYAVREGWSQRRAAAYASGAASFPKTAKAALVAAQMQPGMNPAWNVVVLTMKQPVDWKELAAREDGTVDRIGAATAVISPRRQAYFVELPAGMVGVMQPANRQELSRWLTYCGESRLPSVSRYLQLAVLDTSDKAQIVMAFDAADMLDPNLVKRRLLQTKTLGTKPSEIERLTPILSNIKGMQMRILVGDDVSGKLKVDFGDNAVALAPFFKPLLLEVLEGLGIAIEDFDGWTVKPGTLPRDFRPGERTIALEGKLSESGLRKLLSLVVPQASAFDGSPASLAAPETPAAASLGYYQAVDTLLEDLKKQKAKGQRGMALWFDKYSEKIDALPVLNVDNELLDWGHAIARNFRLLAMSLRGVDVQKSMLECSKEWLYVPPTAYVGYNYASVNAGAYGNNFGQVQNAQTALVLQGNNTRDNLWRQIEDSGTELRRKMTQKYQIEFRPVK